MSSRLLMLLPLLGFAFSTANAADPFAANIRPTKPLTPAEQLKTFHLPKGFEIQLFAAEPGIQKPLNIAFDARGRVWVSGSVEYPYAAKAGKGRDTIKILEDTDGDGRADKITTFADGLNIPIGLYPYRDGVVVYSIPNILFLRDTNGDGKADRREVLYGPLGTPRDVHGLQNAFRRGFDGWLYICHGFSNSSTITGRDGSRIDLQSGNTYRIRLDGSRVEQFTWGQVNPFGMAVAENGDLFTADCHSKPLSLLLRGGRYSSFGKPHDGLGFVQPVMAHSHGSTAISGAAFCTSPAFPAKYRGSLFVGNVMTGRIHRDSLVFHGSTVEAKEEADFLTCDDPWFRPADVRFGPDGALYIADFYNRIIGHYEVPLDHPGRDRRRGRIWRIVYTGKKKTGKKKDVASRSGTAARQIDLSRADVATLIAALADPNLPLRQLATDQLSDRIGRAAIKPLTAAVGKTRHPTVKVHALWALHRLGRLKQDLLIASAEDESALVRIHAMRILSESLLWNRRFRQLAVKRLSDPDDVVRRAAADALGRHADAAAVRPLLNALHKVAQPDAHLRQTIRIALKAQLQQPGALRKLQSQRMNETDRRAIAEITLAVRSEAAAAFLIDQVRRGKFDRGSLRASLAHAAKFLPADRIDALVKIAQEKVPDEIELQFTLLVSIQQSLRQRGLRESKAVRDWSEKLAGRLLASVDDASKSWGSVTVRNPWGLERRNSADGKRKTLFLSSLPGGEQATGILRSKTFTIPKRLQFYICGHLGFPNKPANPKNFVQLRLSGSDRIVARVLAPRNDLAQLVDWKLDKFAGKKGYLEVVDGLNIKAYAWIAVARFEPSLLAVPRLSPQKVAHRQKAAAVIAGQFQLRKLAPALRQLILSAHADWSARAAAGRALVSFRPNALAEALAGLIAEPVVSAKLRTSLCQFIAGRNNPSAAELLSQAMRLVPSRLQRQIARTLAATKPGGEALLTLVDRGDTSARLLRDVTVLQKLLAAMSAKVAARIKQLTSSLP
ncbi:MAG: HEAT repeat domain-containing protein, partial [Planctomycetes bacterium]|nr:HEAT repeat domain-containing protein [Planctomycetota bacterium]